ncbi:GPH family glycoside/pentoside/hexuronide:cation symporter [Neisseria perflava]|nr:GPH family glycoside/pentoside/hexuronide:cation symporter [Neisseria perflava]
MATVISAQPEDRASLSVFRSIGGTVAHLAISLIVPLVVYETIDGKEVIIPHMFTVIMGVFAVLTYIFYQICWRNTVERVHLPQQVKADDHNIMDTLKEIGGSLATNKPLKIFIGVAIVLLLATLLIGTMNPYLYIDYFNNKQGLAFAGILNTIAMICLIPFTSKIVKKFGKKESAAIGTLFTAILYGLMFVFTIQNMWVYLDLALVAAFGLQYFMMIIWSFIADIIDAQYLKTERHEDGVIYAVYSFARKIGQALAGGLGGFALSAIGCTASAEAQTPETINAIYNFATLVPAVSCLIICLMLHWYPLSKNVVLANSAEVEKRSKAAAANQ